MHQKAYTKEIFHMAATSECNMMPTPLPQCIEQLNTDPFLEPSYFRSIL